MKKLALVIGGSGGIGAETAKVLSKNMKVCLTYNKNKVKQNYSGAYKMDIRNEENIKKIVSEILKEHKKIDVVVYSISTPIKNKKAVDLEWSDFQEHIDMQSKGLFSVVKELSPLISQNHGIKFIVVLSESCLGNPPSMMAHYVTGKYSLMGLTKTLAVELAKNNCTFNMVSPGMVKTDLLSNFPSKMVEMAAYNNPMKRIAEPSDVAKVISFLASKDSDYLNGVNIPINGGNIIL
ncbi:SDR family oxidoreductase [Candidatus Woesearchaeota archaeon]|nr:SDR family oxidoreductase [Candidatus Woesearchaeota archaeon]